VRLSPPDAGNLLVGSEVCGIRVVPFVETRFIRNGMV
jgi:hypothetical protein